MSSFFSSALSDLLERYRTVFADAWKHRDEMTPPARLPHELAFLPAAISLQDTPVSAAPRVLAWLLIVFALVALLWSVFGYVEIVATARGRIIPDARTKVVQPFETSRVAAINVRDGQLVRKGQPLIVLDRTSTKADKQKVLDELSVARLALARAEALLRALAEDEPPVLVLDPVEEPTRIASARELLASEYGEFRSKLAGIDAEIARVAAERRTSVAIVRKIESTLPLLQARERDIGALVAEGYASRHEHMEREQARLEASADLVSVRSRLDELSASSREMAERRATLIAETRRVAASNVTEAQSRLAALKHELVKADSRERNTVLRAPTNGTVQQLAVHTVGGVVTPAQPLLLIVPADDSLEIEAMVRNQDIGFVSDGQRAEVKIDAFPFTKYGTVTAQITALSEDAVLDEENGLVFVARVRMDRDRIPVDGKDVRLGAGMAVTVEIKTGSRRVIEYFLSPLIQHTSESLRER